MLAEATHSRDNDAPLPVPEVVLDRARVQLAPRTARYVKLGVNNRWFKSSIENSRIEFGHPDVSDELALSGDRAAIVALHLAKGRDPGKATGYAREILDFYGEGEDCLWITFGDGSLWWAFAKLEVHMLPPLSDGPTRYRELLAPWSNLDLTGHPLSIATLSTRLTQVAAYRQTLCSIKDPDALVRRINGFDEPVVIEARRR